MKRFLARLFPWRDRTARIAQSDAEMLQGMPPMLDCESVMRKLWDYLDGELTAGPNDGDPCAPRSLQAVLPAVRVLAVVSGRGGRERA
ncbi:MAG: hypothetical protein ABR543_05800 [Gemmatimonadaceae bacterium]